MQHVPANNRNDHHMMQTSNGFVQASLLPHTHYAAQGVEEHHHMPPKQQQPRYVAYTRGDAVEPAMMLMKQQQQLFANNFAQQQLASSNHAAAAFYNNHHLLLEKNAAALVAMSCAPHQLVSPSLLPHHPQQQQKQQQQQQYHHYHHFPQQQQAPMTQLQYPTQQQQHLFQSANNNIFASPSHAMVPSLPSIHNFTKLQIEVNTSQNQDDALLDSVAYSKTLSPPSSMDMSNTQTEVAVAQDATEPIAVAATNPEQAISPTKLAAVQRRHEIYDHHHEFHSPLKKRKTARVVYHDNGCQVVPSSNQSSPVHLNDKKEMPTRNMRQPFYDNVPIIKQQQQQLYARSSNVDTDEGDDEEPNDDDEEQEEEEYSHFPHHHHHHESMDDFGAVDDDEEDEEDDDDDHDEDASFSLDSNANNKRKRFNNTKPSNQSLMLMPDDELEPEDEVEDDFDSETDDLKKKKKKKAPKSMSQQQQQQQANKQKATGGKIYDSVKGTTCHQCKQKTADAKTNCSKCTKNSGSTIRGAFCSSCLRNRYGEVIDDAVTNTTWVCPVCRGVCNCSSCRRKLGKFPISITTREALKKGYVSVFHMLVAKGVEKEAPLDE